MGESALRAASEYHKLSEERRKHPASGSSQLQHCNASFLSVQELPEDAPGRGGGAKGADSGVRMEERRLETGEMLLRPSLGRLDSASLESLAF